MKQYNYNIICSSIIDEIEHIEIILSGDHGKGSCIFIVTVIVLYINDKHNAIVIELQTEEIESEIDTVSCLTPLLNILLPGIRTV